MRERHREIRRRRQRRGKRVLLRKKLATTTNDADRQKLLEKIVKTYPRFTTTTEVQ
jgi:hypothetical protein